MPDWKRVMKDIVRSVDEAAREANTKQRTARRNDFAARRNSGQKRCLFWNCSVPIRADHIFCYDHYEDLQDGLIDECPDCNRAKDVEYNVCRDCYNSSRTQQSRSRPSSSATPRSQNRWYKPEYSPAWEKGDATANDFYVYILKLDGGKFYAGQTRELRERLSEHRDGGVQTTRGKNPKLAWFGILPTREAVTTTEVELKKLVDSNPREIRRMIIKFRDLVGELE